MTEKNLGGRPPSVTPDEIFAVADQIARTGETPDYASVFSVLKRGTRTYINKELIHWGEAREKSGQFEIHPDVLTPLKKALAAATHLARIEIQREVIGHRKEVLQLGEDLESALKTQSDLESEKTQLQSEIDAIMTRSKAQQLEIDRLISENRQLNLARDEALRTAAKLEEIHEIEIQQRLRIDSDFEKLEAKSQSYLTQLREIEKKSAMLQGKFDSQIEQIGQLVQHINDRDEKILALQLIVGKHFD